jgi:hypothetical protein
MRNIFAKIIPEFDHVTNKMAAPMIDTDSEDELPPGWEERVSAQGQVYYAKCVCLNIFCFWFRKLQYVVVVLHISLRS